MTAEQDRLCPRCKETKPIAEFKMKRGRPTYCKRCVRQQEKERLARRADNEGVPYIRRSRSKAVRPIRLVKNHDLSVMSKEERRDWNATLRKRKRSAVRERNRKIVWDLLSKTCCKDCGCTNPLVLTFDHLDPKQKTHDVSDLVYKGTLDQLDNELAKCEIVCANCHVIRTASMFGSWRLAKSMIDHLGD